MWVFSDNQFTFFLILHVYSDIVIRIRKCQTPPAPRVRKNQQMSHPPPLPFCKKKSEISLLSPPPPWRLTSYVNGPLF